MGRKKTIILPDRIFHKLWKQVDQCNNFNDYFKSITDTNSSTYINLETYNLDYEYSYKTLEHIYNVAKLDIKDILKQYNLSNAVFSHRFCIPIRTVENWKFAERTCPSYVKLMVLKILGHKLLPSPVVLESEYKHKDIEIKPDIIEQIIEADKSDEKFLEQFESVKPFSLKEWERIHVTNNEDILNKTNYLDSIIHRKD
mgnify:FL=1